MKILVLSDSHSSLRFMRIAIERTAPDAVIHLGDYVRDGEAIAAEYPGIRFYQVAGNCDQFSVPDYYPRTTIESFEGVRIYFTHGHIQHVKQYLSMLIADANRCNAAVALFGHTHEPYCEQMENGLWLMNPGSCSNYGGYAGIVEIRGKEQVTCRLIRQSDMEESNGFNG